MFVGVDVGGTNTDAVLMDGQELALQPPKCPRQQDVTTGIVNAVTELLKQGFDSADIDAVMVGTTHFTNALLEQKGIVSHCRYTTGAACHSTAAADD